VKPRIGNEIMLFSNVKAYLKVTILTGRVRTDAFSRIFFIAQKCGRVNPAMTLQLYIVFCQSG